MSTSSSDDDSSNGYSTEEVQTSVRLATESLNHRPNHCHYSWTAALQYFDESYKHLHNSDQAVLEILQRAQQETESDLNLLKSLLDDAMRMPLLEWSRERHYTIGIVLPQVLLRLCGISPVMPTHFKAADAIGNVLIRILEGRWKGPAPSLQDLAKLRQNQPWFGKLRKFIIEKTPAYRDKNLVDGFIQDTIREIEGRVRRGKNVE